jgi:hypothetical protein
MDQRHLPPREPGELEISAPVSIAGAPLQPRTRVLLAAVALLVVASILMAGLRAVQRGLAAQHAQATQTAVVVQTAQAARASETATARSAATMVAAQAQQVASAHATFAAVRGTISTSAYSVAVPGCPVGDPLWQTSNFDPAYPNFICSADSLQILSGARPHWGITFCTGCPLPPKHDTQIHIFDIQPNVAEVDFSDGPIMLAQHMDGSWAIYGPPNGLLASGTQAPPSDLILRIRSDGSQMTVSVNGVTYATLARVTDASFTGIDLSLTSRDFSQPSAIRVNEKSFTPLP